MSPLTTPDGCRVVVGLLANTGDDPSQTQGERLLGYEPLRVRDVILARDETAWAGVCAGALGADLDQHEWRLQPGESAGRDRIRGYGIEVRSGRQTYRKHFATQTVAAAARRGAARLREQQALGADETYSFFLTTRPMEEDESESSPPLAARRLAEPLVFATEPLAEWLARSRPYIGPSRTAAPCVVEKTPAEVMEVFIPRGIWEDAREMSRLGGENESAAVLLGQLARDTTSPAVFLTVSECLRAEHAVEEKLSVGFSGDTWGAVRTRLEQRRRKLNQPGEMIVGTAHGHNFQPSRDSSGRMTCDSCAVLEVCSRSTCHASDDDLTFHQSVFTGAPYAQLLLWGWNAREEEEWRLYGLKDGTLTPRSVRIVEE